MLSSSATRVASLLYEDIAVERVRNLKSDTGRTLQEADLLFYWISGLIRKQLKGLTAVLAGLGTHLR